MKITFHQVHDNLCVANEPDVLKYKFQKLYENYRTERKILHSKEENVEDFQKELAQVLKTKEELSKIAMALCNWSDSLSQFEYHLQETTLVTVANYIYPLSLQNKDTRSPIDSISSTLENLKIIAEFVENSANHANGMLCSGTNAWGAFYAVRGKVPQTLIDLGVKQEQYSNFSDIDLLISCGNLEQMESLVQHYISKGFIEKKERTRFKIFKNLFRSEQADTFSIRTHYRGTEESLHMVFDDTVSQIANFAEKNRKDGMSFMRDFRPNMPKMPRMGEYPVINTAVGPDSFKTEIKEVKPLGENLGFVWQMPANGISQIDGRKQYTMGILAFFLLIAPIILIDENEIISSNIACLLNNVRKLIHSEKPVYFARRDKVASEVRIKIDKLLKGETL